MSLFCNSTIWLVWMIILGVAACGGRATSDIEVPKDPIPASSPSQATTAEDQFDGVQSDAGKIPARETDAGLEETPVESSDAQPGEKQISDIHPFLERFRDEVGGWFKNRERRALARVDLTGTGHADAEELAGRVYDRSVRVLLPMILDRPRHKQLSENADSLRSLALGQGTDEQAHLLYNFTLPEFSSYECYETQEEPLNEREADRCMTAFDAARIMLKPLDTDLTWPGYSSFGNCGGEEQDESLDDPPCFSTGNKGGHFTLVFDRALELGVPRKKLLTFAETTLRVAADFARRRQVQFEPIGPTVLSSIVHGALRWMTPKERERFQKKVDPARDQISPQATGHILNGLAKRVVSPLWNKHKTKPARRLFQLFKCKAQPATEEKETCFETIARAIDDEYLLDIDDPEQCPQKPPKKARRCREASFATAYFLTLTELEEDEDTTSPQLDIETARQMEFFLDHAEQAGASRRQLLRTLISILHGVVRRDTDIRAEL